MVSGDVPKTRVLVYVRQYFKATYLPLFSAIGGIQVTYLTDFPTPSMHDIRDHFYRALHNPGGDRLSPMEVEEVVRRCRLLRNIQRETAEGMVRAMHHALEAIVGAGEYDVCVGQVVDDYITHLLAIVARARGIAYLGLAGSYFPGHTQITLCEAGTPMRIRDVPSAEASAILSLIAAKDFRQDYLNLPSLRYATHLRQVMRYHAKRIVFAFLKVYRGDPLNFPLQCSTVSRTTKGPSEFCGPTAF